MSRILIIGGTSGLGAALGEVYRGAGHEVHVTGRNTDVREGGMTHTLMIRADTTALVRDIEKLLASVGHIDVLIYAAGYTQLGALATLADNDVCDMVTVGLTAPSLILKKILSVQKQLTTFVAVTSTSQWIPRPLEPIYAGAKAGLAHFAHSVAQDGAIVKTLVVGPSGMATKMRTGRTAEGVLLDPGRVAAHIIASLHEPYRYRCLRILRDPERVEVLETE